MDIEIIPVPKRPILNIEVKLSRLRLPDQRATNAETRENLGRPIAPPPTLWPHINMLGEYHLSDEKLKDSLDILPLESDP